MAYILIRTDGAFVADMQKTRTGSSYTNKLQWAKVYATKEAAERDSCPGNEHAVPIDRFLSAT
mgnify:CR=1 FL=1